MSSTNDIQLLSRMVSVLRAISSGPTEGLRAIDIAAITGIHQATLHRLLTGLAQERLVRRMAGKRFSLGSEALAVGQAAGRMFDIKTMARPSLERLAEEPGDVAFLQIISGPFAVCLDRVEGSYPLRPMTLQPGDRRPLGVGAGSLALLAHLEPAECERIIADDAQRLERFPQFTADKLHRAVAQTRANGFSKVEGDVVAEMCAFGMPILDHEEKPIGALSFAAIRDRLRDDDHALRCLRDEVDRLRAQFAS